MVHHLDTNPCDQVLVEIRAKRVEPERTPELDALTPKTRSLWLVYGGSVHRLGV